MSNIKRLMEEAEYFSTVKENILCLAEDVEHAANEVNMIVDVPISNLKTHIKRISKELERIANELNAYMGEVNE